MFSFLNTWMLLGLAGLSIPILLHFLFRRRKQTVYFSTLRFLKDIEIKSLRRIRWRQTLLLILRCLAVLFLVLAFARPTLNTFGGFSSHRNVMIFLDRSLSMQRGDVFQRAKAAVQNILSSLNDEDQIRIVCNPPYLDETQKPATLSGLQRWVEESDPTWQQGDIKSAFEKIQNQMLSDDILNQQLYFVSDFQESELSSFNDTLSLPQSTQIIFIPIQQTLSNFAIVDGGIASQIIQLNHPVNKFADVQNFSSQTKELILRIFLNNQAVIQESITLQANEKTRHHFSVNLRETGWYEGRIELSEDDFPQDNHYYFQFNIPEKIVVAVVGSHHEDRLPAVLALQPKEDEYPIFQITEYADLTSLSQICDVSNVVFLINPSGLNAEHGLRLRAFMNEGRGVFLIPGPDSDLRQLSQHLLTPAVNVAVQNIQQVSGRESFVTLNQIDYEHPVFENMMKENQQNIRSPRFYKHLPLTGDLPPAMFSFQGNIPGLIDFTVQNGRLILLASGIHPQWSDLVLTTFFAPLINRSAIYLSGSHRTNQDDLFCGEAFNYTLSEYQSGIALGVEDPYGHWHDLIPELNQGHFHAGYSQTEYPGIYRIMKQQELMQLFAVNGHPSESRFEWIQQNQLQEIFKNYQTAFLDDTENLNEQLTTLQVGFELNKWMLILGLFMLILEIIFARPYRKQIVSGEK